MNWESLRVLVTGGGGFLGTGIVNDLVRRNAREVRSLSRREYPHLAKLDVTQVTGDIADPAAVARAADGVDVIFHVAAKAGIWGKYNDYFNTNVVGTTNVIAACHRHDVARLVYTSSPSVVAPDGDLQQVDESTPYPEDYLAHYPKTKAKAERMVMAANDESLLTVSLRPHLIWGPGDNHLVPRIVKRARKRRLRLVGDGSNLVDSVYIENAVAAHIAAAERLRPGAALLGRTYFVTNDEPLSMKALLDKILAAAGLPAVEKQISYERAFKIGEKLEKIYRVLRLRAEPPMTRFLAHQLATSHTFDIAAARRDLGYEVAVSVDQGMKALRNWLRGET